MRLIQKTHYAEDDTATEQERYVAAREIVRLLARTALYGSCNVVSNYADDRHTVSTTYRCEAPQPVPDEIGESSVYNIRDGYKIVAVRFRCWTCGGFYRLTIPRTCARTKNS